MPNSMAVAGALAVALILTGPASTGEAQTRGGRPGSETSYLDRYHPAVVAERTAPTRGTSGDSLHGIKVVEPTPMPPPRRKTAQQYFPGMRPGTYTNSAYHHCTPSRGGVMARGH